MAEAAAPSGAPVVVVSRTPVNGLAPVTVAGPGAATSFRFAAAVPAGGSLSPAAAVRGQAEFSSEVLVKDAAGTVVGAYDAPYAIDAKGALLKATYRIEGANLVQTLPAAPSTAFPVKVLLSDYAPVTSGRGGPTILVTKVTVPSNYVYNPDLGSLHDYCTSSPDSYLAADFRGPCARHDLCYEAPGNHKTACDNALRDDLTTNCDYAYSASNPIRATCHGVAAIYWAAVTAFGDDN
ncbi:phospholipase A2 [Actinoplanes sp. N902-109]|uniref:phospholipase A2 n=1 Tax=Actinoplanes sp. (strain N902-109) TaxID=649831 RepID=UPI0018DD6557|nr:phospholipase A2 [Actinoplanes sp. N902-109]